MTRGTLFELSVFKTRTEVGLLAVVEVVVVVVVGAVVVEIDVVEVELGHS